MATPSAPISNATILKLLRLSPKHVAYKILTGG